MRHPSTGRRFFAFLTILSVAFTQACPAWALRTMGVENASVPAALKAGMEEESVLFSENLQLAQLPGLETWVPLLEMGGNDFGGEPDSYVIDAIYDGPNLETDRVAIYPGPLVIKGPPAMRVYRIAEQGRTNPSRLTSTERLTLDLVKKKASGASPAVLAEEVADEIHRAETASTGNAAETHYERAAIVSAALRWQGCNCGHFSYPGRKKPIRTPIDGIEQIEAKDLRPVFQLMKQGRLDAVTRIDSSEPVYVARESDFKKGKDTRYRVSLRKVEEGGRTGLPLEDVLVGETEKERTLLADWERTQAETARLLDKYGTEEGPNGEKLPDYKKPGVYRQIETARLSEQKVRRELLSEVTHRIHGADASFRNNVLEDYLGGEAALQRLLEITQGLKREDHLIRLIRNKSLQDDLKDFAGRLNQAIDREKKAVEKAKGDQRFAGVTDLHAMSTRLDKLRDIVWEIEREALGLVARVHELVVDPQNGKSLSEKELAKLSDGTIRELLAVDTVFSAFNENMESRGRDSLGVTALYDFKDKATYQEFRDKILTAKEGKEFDRRSSSGETPNHLVHRTILVREDPSGRVSVTLVYKTAQLVGRLGDNVARLKQEMVTDRILQKMIRQVESLKLAHTRWASAGIISIENTHPQSNQAMYTQVQLNSVTKTYEAVMQIPVARTRYGKPGHILVVLNGDITNYNRSELLGDRYLPDLVREFEGRPLSEGLTRTIAKEIMTDTKIIPLVIEEFIARGYSLQEAFRMAVLRFAGSFSIQMISDLEPDKIFTARGGDGQGLYIGISPDGLIPASEPMGFVRRTQRYVNVEPYRWKAELPGEPGKKHPFETPVIAVIDRNEAPTVENIHVYRADNGDEIKLTENDVEFTPATMRDISMDGNPSFFIKEVFGSPEMFVSTIEGRVLVETRQVGSTSQETVVINLEEEQLSEKVKQGLRSGAIRRVILTGMGTAEVAAKVGADIIQANLKRAGFKGTVGSLSSIELGHFSLKEDMSDTLIIAVSQSGATKDTNAALQRAQERKATILGVVNKRDSETVFHARRSGGGVYYTGTGRDIEIAVASTKAFYAQIGALSVLGMGMAQVMGMTEQDPYLVDEANALLKIPGGLRNILAGVPKDLPEDIDAIFAPGPDQHPIVQAVYAILRRPNGSIAGDGTGARSAEEGGIKYRELNYHTINVKDSVADVKHEDTAAEGWQLWMTANVRGTTGSYWKDVVMGELAKMQSHQNPPILIATEAEAKQHLLDQEGKPKFKVKWERPDGTQFERPIDIILVDETIELFAPIYHAMAAHLISYHSAIRINKISKMLNEAHGTVRQAWDEQWDAGMDRLNSKKDGRAEEITAEETREIARSIVGDPKFQGVVRSAFKPVFELRTRLGIDFPLPGHLQGVWDEILIMVERLQGHGPFEAKVMYQRELQPFITVFSHRIGRLSRELSRGIDSIRHQAKFVTVGIEIGGQMVSSVLLPLVNRMETKGFFSETINTALAMYMNYLRDSRNRVQLIQDPFESPTRSRLIVLSPGGDELEWIILNAIDQMPGHPEILEKKGVPFQDPSGNQAMIFEVILDRPVSQLTTPVTVAAGLEERTDAPIVRLVQDALYRKQLGIIDSVGIGNWLVTENGALIMRPGTSNGVNLANIHPSAVLKPGVRLVGAETVVEADAVIGEGSYLDNAKVGRGAQVGAMSILITQKDDKGNFDAWELSPHLPEYAARGHVTEVGPDAQLGERTYLLNFSIGENSIWKSRPGFINVGINGFMGKGVRATTGKYVLAHFGDGSVVGNFEGDFEQASITTPLEVTDFVGRPGELIGQAGRSGNRLLQYVEGFSLPPAVLVEGEDGFLSYQTRDFMTSRGVRGIDSIALEFSGTLNPRERRITRITGREKSGHGILAFGFGWVMGGTSKLIGSLDKWDRDDIRSVTDVVSRYDRTYLGHFAVLAPRGFVYEEPTGKRERIKAKGEGVGRIGNFSLRGNLSAREEVPAWVLDRAVDVVLTQMAEEFKWLQEKRSGPEGKELPSLWESDSKVRSGFNSFIQDAVRSEMVELEQEKGRLEQNLRQLSAPRMSGGRRDQVSQRLDIVNYGILRLQKHLNSHAWEGEWSGQGDQVRFGHWIQKNGSWVHEDTASDRYEGFSGEQMTLEELAAAQPGHAHPTQDWSYGTLSEEDRSSLMDLFKKPGQGSAASDAEVDGMAFVHSSAVIESGAVVESGALIGPNVHVGRDARIRTGANLGFTSVGAGADVGERSKLYGVIVAPGSTVGALSHLRLSWVGSEGEKSPSRVGVLTQMSLSKVQDGSSVGAHVSLSEAEGRKPNKLVASMVVHKDGQPSTLGEGNDLNYARLKGVTMGNENILGSLIEEVQWGNNSQSPHFASEVRGEVIEPLVVEIGGRRAAIHLVTNHGAYARVNGTAKNPVRVRGSFISGLTEVDAGAVVDRSFVKLHVGGGQDLLADFSAGAEPNDLSLSGVFERNGPAYVIRFLVGYYHFAKKTPPEDRWAVGYLAEWTAIQALKRLRARLPSARALGDPGAHQRADPVLRQPLTELIELIEKDFLVFDPVSAAPEIQQRRGEIVETILARLLGPMIREEAEAAQRRYSEFLEVLRGMGRAVEALDGRYRLRYDSADGSLIFTEGYWDYDPKEGEFEPAVYTWVPNPLPPVRVVSVPTPAPSAEPVPVAPPETQVVPTVEQFRTEVQGILSGFLEPSAVGDIVDAVVEGFQKSTELPRRPQVLVFEHPRDPNRAVVAIVDKQRDASLWDAVSPILRKAGADVSHHEGTLVGNTASVFFEVNNMNWEQLRETEPKIGRAVEGRDVPDSFKDFVKPYLPQMPEAPLPSIYGAYVGLQVNPRDRGLVLATDNVPDRSTQTALSAIVRKSGFPNLDSQIRDILRKHSLQIVWDPDAAGGEMAFALPYKNPENPNDQEVLFSRYVVDSPVGDPWVLAALADIEGLVSSNAEVRIPEAGLEEVEVLDLRDQVLPESSTSVASGVSIIAGPHMSALALGAAISKVTASDGQMAAQVVFVVENEAEAKLVNQLATPLMVFAASDSQYGSVEAALAAARDFMRGAQELGTDNQPVPQTIQQILRNLFGIELAPDSIAIWDSFIERITGALSTQV